MGYILGIIIFIIMLTVVAAGIIFYGIIDKEENTVKGGILFLFIMIIAIVIMVRNYTNLVAAAADKFFATRTEIYRCENQGPIQCKYTVNQWQKDSVMWVNILKEEGIIYESNN